MNYEYRMKRFWCHACNREFLFNLNSSEFRCVNCASELIEEINTADSHPRSFAQSASRAAFTSSTPTRSATARPSQEPRVSYEVPLQTYSFSTVRTMRRNTDGSLTILEQHIGPSVFPEPFMPFVILPSVSLRQPSMSYDELLDWISRNDPNRYGPPPAEENAINSLSRIPGSQCVDKECPVCQEAFKEDDQVFSMPCDHCYHENCLVTWLKMHNSCPVCRAPLSINQESSASGVRNCN